MFVERRGQSLPYPRKDREEQRQEKQVAGREYLEVQFPVLQPDAMVEDEVEDEKYRHRDDGEQDVVHDEPRKVLPARDVYGVILPQGSSPFPVYLKKAAELG